MKLKDRTKESIITFETAKLAKELGFNEDCKYYWNTPIHNDITKSDRHWLDQFKNERGYPDPFYKLNEFKAPTQENLQKWIFDNYKIWIEALPLTEDLDNGLYWSVRIFDLTLGRVLYDTIKGTGRPYPLIEVALKKALEDVKKGFRF